MANKKMDVEELELSRVIAPEIKNDDFYETIRSLAATEDLRYVLEIGSSSGGGSTEAFVKGLSDNPGSPQLFCIEISKPRFDLLKKTYEHKGFVHCYNGSTVSVDDFPSPKTVAEFYEGIDTVLRKYPLTQVLSWLGQDIEYVAHAGVEAGTIERIKAEHGIEHFDMVLIDGSEFTGEVEYEKVRGATLVLLDDTNTYKCYNVRKELLADPWYDVIADNQELRNGYSAFRRRKTPKVSGQGLPIHFFTIVLNGEPFIRYHEDVFSRLTVPWHWHVVEGVAALKYDTAWSVAAGGRVSDEVHNRGRSNDGTSAYLDDLAARYPENVTLYRKPLDEFWDGKREMVNAPLPNIKEECLLWQVDNDELWTLEQIEKVHAMFAAEPDRTAAYYWCWYYVGPTKIISTRYNYAQNPKQEWLRTWRFRPDAVWAAHEPPILVTDPVSKIDIAKINPFMHEEMERVGVVFHHFAYATEAQLQFKETYYGYRDARTQWRALQAQTRSGALKGYFDWVSDQTMFDEVANYLVAPIANRDEATGHWSFATPNAPPAPVDRASVARPRIVVDGIYWQHLSSGIGRVWKNLLEQWVASGFAENVIVLDRAGTAPRIDGIHYWSVPAHDYAAVGADSLMLEETCRLLDADLFVSTYYSTPTTTPSFFCGHDMIPEVLGFPLDAEAWREKHRAILHAAGHSMVSSNSADDLARLYPSVERHRIHVTPVGLDPVFARPVDTVIAAFRKTHGLGNRPYALMVGERTGYGGYKNGLLAFRAMELVPDEHRMILVCVGGQPEIEAELRREAPHVELRHLTLNDAELVTAYAGAHALLYPSIYEGFGMPPLEAMATGTPVIVCNNSSIPEVVGDAALFVDEVNPFEMRDAIVALFDPAVRADHVARGIARAAEFSFAHMAQILADGLRETHCRLVTGEAKRPDSAWDELRATQQRLEASRAATAEAGTNGSAVIKVRGAAAPDRFAPKRSFSKKFSREIRRVLQQIVGKK